MAGDYIPHRDAEFNRWFGFLNRYVDEKCSVIPPATSPAWNHIPPEARTELGNGFTAWDRAYAHTMGPHIPEDTSAKNDVKKAAVALIRPFVNRYLRYPPVTKQDREAMGIPEREGNSSPVPPPESQAEADLIFPGIHLVELIRIRTVGAAAPDPRSNHGVRIYYGLMGSADGKHPFRLASPPKTASDLPYSVFTRRKKQRFDFDGESGNRVYFCLCYENPSGDSGPFGPMLSAVIP